MEKIKVFQIGFNKCGTMSLCDFFIKNGHKSVHWGDGIWDNHFKKNISECAKNLGILFQIKDDLLDYSTDSKKLGKPIFQDLREGKVTYPFYFAYKKANKAEKLNLESFLGKSNLNKKVAYELIEKLGGIKKTELLAATYFKKATQKANLIKDEYIKQEMLKLIILALNREK